MDWIDQDNWFRQGKVIAIYILCQFALADLYIRTTKKTFLTKKNKKQQQTPVAFLIYLEHLKFFSTAYSRQVRSKIKLCI